ncbi:hypothetical protein AVEN_128540-1 [Araneus ventricosus]|uniref:Uncharacterized protein n=1 Tax=Araneus ventricosus TaxID=182803 RepID=A0A4Y2G991_ARAVE|nr:hypothetical protein AVEN_102375-1 [Araneus ventricosus]GBM48494.1 hypothetical protein AVEN_128540-1 [Araneus ventricosus]
MNSAEIQKFEDMVNIVVSTINSTINPFTSREDMLANISNGAYVTDAVQLDLTRAKILGEDAYEKYCKERLLEGNSIDIYSPINKQKLLTFSSIGKKSVSKEQVNQKIFKNATDLSARIIVLGQSTTLDMKIIMNYNLNMFPPVIANTYGSLVKNSESTLSRGILGLADSDITLNNLPSDSSIILDGMAVFQQMKNIPATFGELAFNLLVSLMCL